MCGIIGYTGEQDAGEIILDGLRRLDYRGYDSSGLVVVSEDGMDVRKETGDIETLAERHDIIELAGDVGIGHTRWATHGGVTEANAHPHTCCDDRIAIVHNGIIENHEAMRQTLEDHEFTSETDSEIIAHFLSERIQDGVPPDEAIAAFLDQAEGALAVAAVDQETGDLYGFRRGSPLAVGISENEVYVGSDVHAFDADEVVFLHDDEYVVVQGGAPTFYHRDDGEIGKEAEELSPEDLEEGKQDYDHYMLKEIEEQPEALQRLQTSLRNDQAAALDRLADRINENETVIFTAAGTSYHATLLGVYYLQKAGVDAQTLIASEFQNYERVDDDTLVIAVSQSGETRDTLDAVEYSRREGADIGAVVNVPHSSLERESDVALRIKAGREKCVAATKTFSNTVLALLRLAEAVGYDADLDDIDRKMRQTIDRNRDVARSVAERFSDEDDMYIIGRGETYPVAREVALKLKEIPYVHAEGMMGGELKHGTLALIEDGTPVFALIPGDDGEILSNVSEIEARGGEVVEISPDRGTFDIPNGTDAYPLLATTIGFLLSYELGRARGCPIDKPRNLAKTVTVR